MTTAQTQTDGSVVSTAAERRYPLSPFQDGIWALEQLHPGNPAYVISSGIRLDGPLDRELLEDCIRRIWWRHESLRCRFITVDGVPYQKVGSAGPPRLQIEELPEEAGVAEPTARIALREAGVPFDLTAGPAVRMRLLRFTSTTHVLLLTLHHLVVDAWSSLVWMRELAEFYEAAESGRPHRIPALQITYGEYARRAREKLAGSAAADLVAHWIRTLEGAPDGLDLPMMRRRPQVQSFEGAQLEHVIPPAVAQNLRELGRREGATLFMTLLAVLKAFLFRHTAREDFVVGVPISLRAGETAGLIGMFVNTVAMRTSLAGDPGFPELVGRVKETALDAYTHWELPFEKLVTELRRRRDPGRNPIFQVLFNALTTRDDVSRTRDLTLTMLQLPTSGVPVDLQVTMVDSPDRLTIVWNYATALFDRGTIERLAASFNTFLGSLAADPEQRLSRIGILSEEQKHRTLVEWNQTDEEFPEVCLQQLIERQARQRPEAVAVISGQASLRYRELDTASSALAGQLQALGLRPGDRVGVFMDRSVELVIALLAVLRAGAAYVPLDPDFPESRLEFMLADSRVAMTLTQSSLQGRVPPSSGRVVVVDELDLDSGKPASPRAPTPEDLAYVIYTSGSTGQPNGVEVSHRALVNFLCSMCRTPGLDADDVLLSVTTISFDIAALELFGPLVCGATTVVVPRETARDGSRLAAEIERHSATVLQGTPATWQLLLESGWGGSPQLKALCGGEPLPSALAEQLLERTGALWNLYGPTETTVWSTVKRVHAGDPITIGRPIANTRVYVLDEHLQPVPSGVAGQLCIAGAGLARGYLGRPELTGRKFTESPTLPGERLYLTGDLGRHLSDGEIECLGRLDNQIKVRGFRIEPGEIEAALVQLDGVLDATVASAPGPGGPVLTAFLRTAGAESPTERRLIDHLQKQLPAYMVPTRFVRLDELPRLPNGKVDRRALRSSVDVASPGRVYVAAENALQQQLVELWERVLGRDRIGIDDDFFELGGHSLLAARLFALMHERLGLNLPLATLFAAPTIRSQAELAAQDSGRPAWDLVVPIRTGGARPPLFCVHGAEGNVLIYRDLASRLAADQPVYGLQAPGLDGREEIPGTLEEIAARHIEALKRVRPEGPYALGGYCMGGAVAYEMARQLTRQGDEVTFVALIETYNIAPLAVLGPPSLTLRVRHRLENLAFHLRNVLLLKGAERNAFLKRKASVETTRLVLWLKAGLHHACALAGRPELVPEPAHRRVMRANDSAAARYVPQPYRGRVVLFRPKAVFSGLEDSGFGWAGYADIETRLLPVYPRGMLIEPFVKTLAAELETCLTTPPRSDTARDPVAPVSG